MAWCRFRLNIAYTRLVLSFSVKEASQKAESCIRQNETAADTITKPKES